MNIHTTINESYTLSLHDALPIFLFHLALVQFIGHRMAQLDEWKRLAAQSQVNAVFVILGRNVNHHAVIVFGKSRVMQHGMADRKSTRLNSSYLGISYAVL